MRHFFYVLLAGFALLILVATATEKPRQYRVAKAPEKTEPLTLPDLTEPAGQPITPALSTTSAAAAAPTAAAQLATHPTASRPQPKPPPSATTVVAYSRNDVGGKIVLTASNCERNTGLAAYTTHPDGAIDFGCWNADELFIMIFWDKAGLQNYSHERFHSVKTHDRLSGTALLDQAREPLSRFANKPPSALARKQ